MKYEPISPGTFRHMAAEGRQADGGTVVAWSVVVLPQHPRN